MHDRTALRALGPLLDGVVRAEELSRDMSASQASLAPPGLAAVLRRQSRQESAHVLLFRAALRCVGGSAAAPARVQQALEAYERQLRTDLAAGAIARSLVGLQCVLEGLAEVALQPPQGMLGAAADQLVPMRACILHQEHGHQRLGELCLARMAPEPGATREAADEYVELALDLLDAGLATLDCLRQDRVHYGHAVPQRLAAIRDRIGGAAPAQDPAG